MMTRHPADRIHTMACTCADCSGLREYQRRRMDRARNQRLRIRTAVIGLIGGALLLSAYAAIAGEPTIIDLTIGARP